MSAGTAFLFPGQASQFVGMGADLRERHPMVRETFEEADGILGFDLSRVCFEGPMERLSQTEITQPAVYVHSVAVARLLAERGLRPDAVAGHSLGEYSALTAAGVIDFPEGLSLVRERGRLMQAAGGERPGKMAAVIGLEDDVAAGLCEEIGAEVVPANYNSPGQVVLSGESGAVERAMAAAEAAGARRVVELPVSGAFHSPLMASAAEGLAPRLAATRFRPPSVPVVTNVTAAPETDPRALRRLLFEQMTAPVRWTESVRALSAMGVERAYEVGPGSVLKGLSRRILRDLRVETAGTAEEMSGLETGV